MINELRGTWIKYLLLLLLLLSGCQTSKKTLMLDSEQYCVLIETMYKVNTDKAHHAFKNEDIDYCF